MKTKYVNPKTESLRIQSQISLMGTSPYADPTDSENGGTGNMGKLC